MSKEVFAAGLTAAALATGVGYEATAHSADHVAKAAASAGKILGEAANSAPVKAVERAADPNQHYSIPSGDKPYREVVVGTAITYDNVPIKDQIVGDTGTAWSATSYDSIDSIAKFTSAANSTISPYAIADLLRRENVKYQQEQGIPQDKIDPNKVVKGQVFRLPEIADHVGTKIVPEKQGTMPNGMKVTISQHQARY